MTLHDKQGRKHDYLRISVTDRCNLRCLYCMDEDGVDQIAHDKILRYEDIIKVVKAGAELGISKIRLTGGEPLVRKNIVELVHMIASVPGISDIAMTTNGTLLPRYAAGLKKAGLNRVNISLDTLVPEKYGYITRCGRLEDALTGIEQAFKHDLQPVKINTVLIKGFNDSEVGAFLELACKKPLHIRFIEYMPIGDHDRNYDRHYLSLDFVRTTARSMGLTLNPAPLTGGAGPAESYSIEGGEGTVGLIHPVSKHFCGTCNRLRLTAEGNLKACLYWQEERPVQPVLDDKEALQSLFREVLSSKSAGHLMTADGICGPVNPGTMRTMSKIGG